MREIERHRDKHDNDRHASGRHGRHKDEQGSDSDTLERGREIAGDLESAVRNSNQAAYATAMDEVTRFRDTHKSTTYKNLVTTVTNKLSRDGMLNDVALYQADLDFDRKGENLLEQRLGQRGRHLASRDGSASRSEVRDYLQTTEAGIADRHASWLFDHKKDGTRPIFDSVKEMTQEQLLDKLKFDHGLSQRARSSLEWAAKNIDNSKDGWNHPIDWFWHQLGYGKPASLKDLEQNSRSSVSSRDINYLFDHRNDGKRPLFDSVGDLTKEQLLKKLNDGSWLPQRARSSLEWAVQHMDNSGNGFRHPIDWLAHQAGYGKAANLKELEQEYRKRGRYLT